MNILKTLVGTGGLVCLLGGWSVANAITVNEYTFDFSNDGSSSYSSSMFFSSEGDGSLSLTAYGKTGGDAEAGPANKFGLGRWQGYGLGVKNNIEKSGWFGWNYDDHYVDNSGSSTDFVLLDFGQSNVKVTEIVLAGFGDTDITLGYGDIWNSNLADIEGGPRSNGALMTMTPGLDVFSNQWRIFAQRDESNDKFKIKSLTVQTSAVPLPAAAWLFGSALLGMVGIGYRRRSSE